MALSRPVVVILGWLGSRPKNLRKIARFYDGLGVDCETFIESPVSLLHIREQKSEMNALYKKTLNRPIILHGFSLTGASAIVKTFCDDDFIVKPELDVRGLIFDSMPGRLPADLHRYAFSKALFPNSRFIEKAALLLLRPVFDIFMSNYTLKYGQTALNKIFRQPWKQPTLLLGSEKDALIPNSELVEYASVARKAGVDLQTRFWPDSGHIRLSLDHADEYKEIVRSFVKRHVPTIT
jgi:pimeloyl-ACP methyl ester carboxylesterase